MKSLFDGFENYFNALKNLCDDPMFEIWPNFEPQYDEHGYSWTTLQGLGKVLQFNCGVCNGPSDLRMPCAKIVPKREANSRKKHTERLLGVRRKNG